MSASMIVVGDIGKVGSRYIISSKMLETETARTLNTADGIYINLDSLIDDIYSFTEKLSGITEQVPEEIVEKKPPELPEEKEMASGEEQEKLLGEKAEPQKVEHYLTVGAGFGLTFPIGAAADVLGFAYNPLASINYNIGLPWGVIGFGLAAGTNITFTNSDTDVQYGLYSIPVAASLTYRTNFKLPLFFIVEVNPGVAFTILNYSGSGFNENSGTHTSTTFFLAAKLGAGIDISRGFGVFAFGNFILITFANAPYLGISPGINMIFRF